jgi:predicted nucleic acid-binding protein
MRRFFIDTSVFFPAIHSSRGHARDLFMLAGQELVRLVASDWVLEETRRNLADFAPERIVYLDYLLTRMPLEVVTVTRRGVLAAAKRVVLKDAPIVAAARKAKVEALVTYDRKHLLGKPEVAKYIRAQVITPEGALELIENQSPKSAR